MICSSVVRHAPNMRTSHSWAKWAPEDVSGHFAAPVVLSLLATAATELCDGALRRCGRLLDWQSWNLIDWSYGNSLTVFLVFSVMIT